MRDTAVLRHYLTPLLPLLEPQDATELVINRPGEAGIEDRQGWRWHDLPELDCDWLGTLAVAAASFTHQDIDGQSPICSTVLPGGERCQIVIPSVTPSGCPSFTIRKPSTVTLPIAADAAVRRLLDGDPVRVGDLPELDSESALVVARRLLREAVVVVAP